MNSSLMTKQQGRFGLSRFPMSLPAWWESGGIEKSTRDRPKRFFFGTKTMKKGTDTTKKTQCDRVLKWLERKPITPLEAWIELGIYRLSARIKDLRDRGHEIASRSVTASNRFGETCRVSEYSMVHGTAVLERPTVTQGGHA